MLPSTPRGRPNFVRMPTTPDRFIPSRDSGGSQTQRESFLLSRMPDRLSASERITRTIDTGPDPFSNSIPPPLPAARTIRTPNSAINVQRFPRSSVTSGTRQVSQGTVWQVGGAAAMRDSIPGVADGRGGLLARGTNAPLYSSNFVSRADSIAELDLYERRLAAALAIDISARTLQYTPVSPASTNTSSPPSASSRRRASVPGSPAARVWKDNEWVQLGSTAEPKKTMKRKKAVPIIPFRYVTDGRPFWTQLTSNCTVLDAPSLRDDYYCSLLAYSPTANCLAVGLGSHVYLWTESPTIDFPDSLKTPYGAHVTSLAFSSTEGEKAILAIGRADGRIILWSPREPTWRFDSMQPNPVCCVSFRPQPVKKVSTRDSYITVDTEELLIGDEIGHIYIYSVEWPSQHERELFGWPGALTLLGRITAHNQQICGLAWSSNGEWFATGGNDNICHLFQTKKVLESRGPGPPERDSTIIFEPGASQHVVSLPNHSCTIPASVARHIWTLQAAVKAIAFCPWQHGLLAVGGGSNDRCVHFYHTISGACLATIDCCAQVTSLIWSTTRREIAVTFGFAQPEHPYRIAVFAWPSCKQVVAIPWYDEHRALYAIPYQGGPNTGRTHLDAQMRAGVGEGGVWWNRTQEEGCIVVATSDCSIKFHEVWAEEKKATATRAGMLGGSDILEALHGIEKVGEVIR